MLSTVVAEAMFDCIWNRSIYLTSKCMSLFRRQYGIERKTLNYRWEMVNHNLLSVYIPSLSTDCFQYSDRGQLMKPVSLVKLIDLPVRYAFVPENTTAYLATLEIQIKRTLYDTGRRPLPLRLDVWVESVGRSSRCAVKQLSYAATDTVLARMEYTIVNLNPVTGRPAPFPEAWRKQFPSHGEKKRFKMPEKPNDTLQSVRRVHFSDIDENGHTNFACYVRFCTDALSEHIACQKFTRLSDANHVPVKKLALGFYKESKLGDVLTIDSWEDPSDESLYCFHVSKEMDVLVSVMLSVYTDL